MFRKRTKQSDEVNGVDPRRCQLIENSRVNSAAMANMIFHIPSELVKKATFSVVHLLLRKRNKQCDKFNRVDLTQCQFMANLF